MKDIVLGIIGTALVGLLAWTSLSIISMQQDVALIKQQIDMNSVNLVDKVDNLKAQADNTTIRINAIEMVQIDHGKRIVRIETFHGSRETLN